MRNNMKDQKKPIYKKWWFWLIVVVVLFIAVPSSSKPAEDKPVQNTTTPAVAPTPTTPVVPEKKPKWEAALVSGTALDPATARVTITVKNVGDAPGTPVCNVRLQNPSNAYKGSQSQASKVESAPGESQEMTIDVLVKNNGAYYAKEATVFCS